jgi:hypothetical protein
MLWHLGRMWCVWLFSYVYVHLLVLILYLISYVYKNRLERSQPNSQMSKLEFPPGVEYQLTFLTYHNAEVLIFILCDFQFTKLCNISSIYSKVEGHSITGHQGPRGGVVVYIYSFSTSALGGGGCSAPLPGRFTPGKDPVPIVEEVGWAPESVWTCVKISPHRHSIPGLSSP